MSNKLSFCLKCIVLLINIFLTKNKIIHINKIKLFPCFIKNVLPHRQKDSPVVQSRLIRKHKHASYILKKKDNPLKLSKEENISKESSTLDYLSKFLDSTLNRKYEYMNNSLNTNFTINNLVNYLERNGITLQNIKFTEHSRKSYAYTKNRIYDFIEEHKVQVNENFEKQVKGENNNKSNKENGSEKIKYKPNGDNYTYTSDDDNIILCMNAKREIKKSEVICSIPNSYIINFDHVINQIQNFVNSFSNSYNVNYIKYIFKNNMEEQVKELDPLAILMYDIYTRHISFLSFMKSPHIYLKYWDIKLTLIITYIYFISKYVNILLYAYNFNNTFFLLLNKYFEEIEEKRDLCKNELHIKEQTMFLEKNNNILHINDKADKAFPLNFHHMKEINSMLHANSYATLKNEKSFLFYKNYEYYINYIVNKKMLSHLPLFFSDSSFFLFNNTNIKNIIYFRRQMIHEIVNLYKNNENNDYNFLFIHSDIIDRILFTNNKYYSQIEHYLKNCNTCRKTQNLYISKLQHVHMVDQNELYKFILLGSDYSNVQKQNLNHDHKNYSYYKDTFNQIGINSNPISGEENFSNGKCNHLNDNFEHIIRSVTYDSSLFKSFDELFNYNFLMHIYSYVSSHVIKIKSDIILIGDKKKNEIIKQEDEENGHYNNLKDNILNSSIKMTISDYKVAEQFSVKECSKYDFSEYEKKEKEDENRYMCLIPIIDICNHRNLFTNSIIKKEIKQIRKKKFYQTRGYRTDENSKTYHNYDGSVCVSQTNNISIKKKEVNEISEESAYEDKPEEKTFEEHEKNTNKNNDNNNNDNNNNNNSSNSSSSNSSSSNSSSNSRCNSDTNDNNSVKDSPTDNVYNVELISSEDIGVDEEITISYGKLSNDLLLLEYGFIEKKSTRIYFHFDVKIIREIIIQILGFDKLPLIMLESLPQVKVELFKLLNIIPHNDNVYERFDINNAENAKITRKKKEILNDYVRKNKYFNEYNIFTMKERINKFYIDEKLHHSQQKKYFYIGTDNIIDPILLAVIRIIIYDDLNHLSKIDINDLLKWEQYLSVSSEIIVLHVLIKLIDEIIYEQFYDINYEKALKEGMLKYADLKFLQNKFLQGNLFNSDKSINVFEHNNFNIVLYKIMKLKELQNAKIKLTQKYKHMKNLLKN
ncbi:conserved Plasmodium protein, unknown function [Plasmodium malariae]|uniref:SET domain-containing protein n=1 Tax=Plasmodium malariae TaxID=5858 RepID=A0A1D3TDZ4_PLAMA|nr:conserved Plasmodium protein, unknown function [Plasmodium malariae]SCP03159.1 conserved Plasmodium protein, unknown function [Plasmodium malariae]